MRPPITRGIRFNQKVVLALLGIFVFVPFLPSLQGDFVGWDDNVMVLDNPLIKGVSLTSLQKQFTQSYSSIYHPLVLLSYTGEYYFFRLKAFFYHLTNLLLHTLSTLLVFLIISRLGGNIAVSFFTALLFGIHPLRVESVSWVTERKDVLSGFFFLVAGLAYLVWNREKKLYLYGLTLFCYLFALLSKPTVVPFPLILLLLDWLERKRCAWQALREKIPFLLLSLLFGLLAIQGQYSPRTALPHSFSLGRDIPVALGNIVFYLRKILFPLRLSVFYPYPAKMGLWSPRFLLLLSFNIALGVLAFASLRFTRKITAAFAFFLIMLLPVLKLAPFAEEFARADRYTYLSAIGLFILLGAGIWRAADVPGPRRACFRFLFALFALFLAGFFSVLTWQRCQVWKDTIVLFTDVLDKFPDVAVAHANLGTAYGNLGRHQEELACYRRYLELRPERLDIYRNIASAYQQMGEYEKEIDSYQILLGFKGEDPEIYNLMGVAYGRLQKYDLAAAALGRAVELRPLDPQAHNNLGLALGYLGRNREAAQHFQKSIELSPGDVEAYVNLSSLYRALGDEAAARKTEERCRQMVYTPKK